MKIGLVLSKTPSYSETFFISKIKGLQQSGIDVTLFVQQKSTDFSLCPVRIAPKVFKRNIVIQCIYGIAVMVKLLFYPRRLKTFMSLEKKGKRSRKQMLKNLYNNTHILTARLDWLHFGFATMAIQSEHVAKAMGTKMAVSLRGFDVDVYPLKHPNCYTLLWQQVDRVHSISYYLLEKAYKQGLSKRTSYQIITPAIDTKKFDYFPKVINDTLQFLTIGRLHWIKGISYTLEALEQLKSFGIKFHYTIVGSGLNYEAIAFTIHQLQLIEEVTIIGDISHDETITYLSKSNIYIQYSESEGFCNAVLEAQAAGSICVVSDGGALSENIIDGYTGWVVPKRNPKALAETLLEVIHLPEENKERIRQHARSRVIKSFNLEKQQKEFSIFYS
jgi:colanic acid/amylovoran biosynthesis glycosyltransferase